MLYVPGSDRVQALLPLGNGAVMQTWIFQGNPDQFDLDAYLGTSPTQLPWLVTRYAQQIEVGDRVFIWRTQGSAKADADVVAEATVVGPSYAEARECRCRPFLA